jgi:hypothetical protein
LGIPPALFALLVLLTAVAKIKEKKLIKTGARRGHITNLKQSILETFHIYGFNRFLKLKLITICNFILCCNKLTHFKLTNILVNGTASFKNVNNCLNNNIYSYLERSGGKSSNLYLNVVHCFNTSVDKTSVAA